MTTADFEEKPYAVALSSRYRLGVKCFYCFQSAVLTLCADCKCAYYCSSDCKKKDFHLHECQILASHSETDRESLSKALELRLIIKVLTRHLLQLPFTPADDLNGQFPSTIQFRQLDDLLSRQDLVRNWSHYATFWQMFQQTFAAKSRFFAAIQRETFESIAGIVACNSFDVLSTAEGNSVGVALYMQSSRFDHRCLSPDLDYSWAGTTLQVKSVAPSRLPFDELTISYVRFNGLPLRDERQEILKIGFGFACSCSVCLDKRIDECQKWAVDRSCKSCSAALLIKLDGSPECSKCGQTDETIAKRDVKQIHQFWREYLSAKGLTRAEAVSFLAAEEGLHVRLHPILNCRLTRAKSALLDSLANRLAAPRNAQTNRHISRLSADVAKAVSRYRQTDGLL